jgi:hypothetical protein
LQRIENEEKENDAMKNMIFKIALVFSLAIALASALVLRAQKGGKSEDQESNIETYMDLLRSDVKAEKVQIIAVMMQFSPDQAAAFWPIYNSYDADLTKLGDQKIAIIKDYAANYDSMTDAKADELIERSIAIVSERNALLKQAYEQVKAKLGAKEAARFVQVEHQLLLIIDLQIASQLPAIK